MIEIARRWRVLASGVAAGMAGVLGLAGHTASAEPVYPQPPAPAPATVTQTVTAAPAAAPAAPQSIAQPRLPAARVATPAVPTIVPATSVTLKDFLADKGVKLEPQVSRDFKALTIVLPMPPGWSHVPDPNVPDAFAVIADRRSADLYTPNAQVLVYKLIGDFDPKEAISHGFIDSQELPAWRAIDASMADFYGFPSSFIEGTYRASNEMLNTSRRHVIATAGQDRYLVSLSVNYAAGNQGASAAADATDAIVKGFKVTVPAPPTPAPAPPPPGPPAPPGLQQMLGLPG
ncbi:LpqN/LpqT family lipoprotein [Mycobacterium hubeiense]|uniref:LpqN/LpqT family lipoprotein n=1 Tax=Mycobacterium hubeiense TaxID=1867256 RepID=UPI000C7EA298|nr:LpqN/LpqT family lipoprotein [Mycobacterium sp. QGD 101]